MLDTDLDTARWCQLLHVDFGPHAPLGASLKDARCLVGSEESLVTEDVDKVGQPLLAHFGNHLADEHIHILALSAGVFATHGMGAKEGGHHLDGRGLADAADDAQHLEFVLGVQTVAALDLDGAGTLGNDFAHAAHSLTVEFLFTQEVQAVGRVENAASTACNLGIGEPADLVHKLALTAAGIHDVGVAVAPRGQHGATLCIDHLPIIGGHGHGVHFAPRVEAVSIDEQPGIVDAVERCHLVASQAMFPFGINACQTSDILDQSFHQSILLFCKNSTDLAMWGYMGWSSLMNGTHLR